MNSSIWTTILYKNGNVEAVYEYASREPDLAQEEIQKRYPDRSILAIILGRNISTYTFDQNPIASGEVYTCTSNQPTGGSD